MMTTAATNNPSPISIATTSSFTRRLSSFPSYSTSLRFRFPEKRLSSSFGKTSVLLPKLLRLSYSNTVSASNSFDVIVIGAGIIGLTIARRLLLESDLSVAVVDAAVPCSGATGAGQGYIWMMPKNPGTDVWELAIRSQRLWNLLAESIHDQGWSSLDVMGWKKTGSLLIGRSLDESLMLKKRVNQLIEAGMRAEFLSSSDLLLKEPSLMVAEEGGAAFLPDDCQLDAQKTVAFILESNRMFAGKGQFAEFYNNPVTSLLRSGRTGEIEGVQTLHNTLYMKKAIIVAAGCWTGSLMNKLMKGSDITLNMNIPVKPRKGYLLVLENFDGLKLNHGVMEAGYVGHQSGPVTSEHHHDKTLSISMTATIDSTGNLLLGSSRQFAGFDTEVDDSIIHLIWNRAAEFFPSLRGASLAELCKSKKVRVGLRPYMPDGKPVIGRIPGLSKVFVAAGHEGEGLSLAMGTAEVMSDMVLGNPTKVDIEPFSAYVRFSS